MSLLHTIESVPSRIRGLFAYLLTLEQGIAQEDLEMTLSPRILQDNQNCARKTIKKAQELKLIEINKDKIITLHPELLENERNPKDTGLVTELLPSIITRLAFTNQNNNDNEDLGLAISWVLTRSPLDTPLDWSQADIKLRDLNTSKGINNPRHALGIENTATFGNLKHWITYLGFAREEDSALVSDSTIAIRKGLKTVLPDKKTKDLSNVIKTLAKILPVIDGGRHNLSLFDRYPNLIKPTNGRLSSSLSMALFRLKEEGYIKLEHRADSPTPKTIGIAGIEQTYTTIQRIILED